jgi:hypothetical protein
MSEIAGLAIGAVLGLWCTHRLARDTARVVRQRSVDLTWWLRHWTLRYASIVVALGMLAAWSTSAPLAALGGFWLGRTGYVIAALLHGRRFA